MKLEPFDILAVAGSSRVSSAIRWATSRSGDPATISHVSFVVSAGDLYSAVIQEALWEHKCVLRHTLGDAYSGHQDRVSIWRPLDLDDDDRRAMLAVADATVGARYGFGTIVYQLVDQILSKIRGKQVRFARRFASTATQICSENVSEVWQAAGYSFGVEPGTASPDDINDFCAKHPDKYELVRSLERVPAREQKENAA